jgi:S1-C subfamily serine protease
MFLFRSLTIGLLGACVLLLVRADLSGRTTAPPPALDHSAPTAATIVDVAPGVPGATVSSLIRLSPGERVVAVDDRAVDSDLEAGVAISTHPPTSGAFVDLEVASGEGEHRRVLVLMH